MTSSDSSVPDPSSGFAALLCTYKRGAAVALFPIPELLSEESLFASVQQALKTLRHCASAQPESFLLEQTSASGFAYSLSSSHFAFCSGMTAENLAQLFKWALVRAGKAESELNAVGVVVGPGSFTGLRLGCAFANGLSVGRKRALWAIQIPSEEFWESVLAELPEERPAEFCAQKSEDADDPFATGTRFSDIFIALKHWQNGSAHLVDVLEPHYGREPTPVLKLKKERETHSS